MTTSALPPARRLVDVFVKPDATEHERERRRSLSLALVVILPLLLVFVMADTAAGRSMEALATLGFVVLSCGALGLNRLAEDPRWGFRVPAGSVLLLLGWMVYLGAGDGFALVWFYLLPAPLLFLFGFREGCVWFGLSLAIAVALVYGPIGAPHDPDLALRFTVTYGLAGMLGIAIERSRASTHLRLGSEKQDLEEALSSVRTLSKMIPMCAWCRKVRSDDGFWSRIEEYLDRQAGAQISHALCDDCARSMAEGELDSAEGPGAA